MRLGWGRPVCHHPVSPPSLRACCPESCTQLVPGRGAQSFHSCPCYPYSWDDDQRPGLCREATSLLALGSQALVLDPTFLSAPKPPLFLKMQIEVIACAWGQEEMRLEGIWGDVRVNTKAPSRSRGWALPLWAS